MSASAASPGPFTTQPMTATFTGLSSMAMRRSTSCASPMRSTWQRPHVGQLIELGVAAAQVERAEQRPAGAHFRDGVVGERDAHGVADALLEQDAQAAGAFDDALERGARLGDADVQRDMRELACQLAVRGAPWS